MLSWAAPNLPVLLNMDHPVHQSPSPALQSLLVESVLPEKSFQGFAPISPEGSDAMHPDAPPTVPVATNPAPSPGSSPPLVMYQAAKTSEGWEVVWQSTPVWVSDALKLAAVSHTTTVTSGVEPRKRLAWT